MTSVLRVLNGRGDTKIEWDHNDPSQVESARKIIHDLRLQGYLFFLVDGNPADEVTAGSGALIVRKLTAEEVVEEPSALVPEIAEAVEPVKLVPGSVPGVCAKCGRPRHRGRCRKAEIEANVTPDRHVVGVRPVRGG
jgi:hypothetical protein